MPTISNMYASTTPTVTLAAGTYCIVVSKGSNTASSSFTAREANNGYFRVDVKCRASRRLSQGNATVDGVGQYDEAGPAEQLKAPAIPEHNEAMVDN